MTTAAAHQQARQYVENRHIEYIPPGARHGKPWQQFFFWFGGNTSVFNLVLGGVVVGSIGLTFWWALIAITVGTMIGALLIAAHAAQGPKLGVPQTIQTRAQLGYYGASFMFVAVLVLNIGFIAAELVIQAQATGTAPARRPGTWPAGGPWSCSAGTSPPTCPAPTPAAASTSTRIPAAAWAGQGRVRPASFRVFPAIPGQAGGSQLPDCASGACRVARPAVAVARSATTAKAAVVIAKACVARPAPAREATLR
jgi:hypothetical protein